MSVPEEEPAYTAGGKPLPLVRDLLANQKFLTRFRAKIDSKGKTLDECHDWTAAKEEKGYGKFRVSEIVGPYSAHRVAFALANGFFPSSDLMVIHSCDNPACCNPAHLRLGTVTDNNRDIVEKGRHGNMYVQSVLVLPDRNQTEPGEWQEACAEANTLLQRIEEAIK